MRLGRGFLDFWFARLEAEPAAAFRVTLGCVLMFDVGVTFLPHLDQWFGPQGLYEAGELDWWLAQPGRWSLLDAHSDLAALRWAAVGLMVAAYGLIFGLGTRLCALAAFVLLTSFHHRNPNILNAGDILLRSGLFYLALMPSWRAWSLDRLLGRRLGWHAAPLLKAWPVRLAQIQLCLLYLFTGIEKCRPGLEGDWLSGDAVGRSLRFVTIARVDWFSGLPLWLGAPVTWLTLAWELAFGLLVLWQRTRPAALAFGVLVHAGIFATMEVTHFSFTILAFYWLFVPASVLMDMRGQSSNGERRLLRVFYDTMCPVCNRARRTLQRLDWLGRLKFEDLHDRPLCEAALPGVTYADQLRAMYVLRPDGRHFAGFDALRALMPVLPLFWMLWPLWMLAWLPGFSHLGRALYRYIARNRFRYASCDSEVCSLHLKLLAGREMDDEVVRQVVALHERFSKSRPQAAASGS
ncbi:MAG: hypothetical protein HPKKFMNG_01865 [Planctomycetes bacterium]|nr:hypothetical protein [Planctomycetota bacterium]